MIPVNEPLFGEKELAYVTDCVRTGWVSSAGKYINEFEEKWSAYCGRKYGVAVANGTVALQLAVAALELESGSEIIMPSFTIISCAAAAIYNNCIPVFADCDPETWCITVDEIVPGITEKTRAIMPVHIYGHPAEMDPIINVAKKHGLAVIEDAAEAHGAEYLSNCGGKETWKRCGSFGDVSCFSFYANKLVTTGEGGMLVTDNGQLAERARLLRNLAFEPDRRFHHAELGFNFRFTNIQAALGLAQVERMDEIIERKRRMANYYSNNLAGIDGLQLPVERDWARSVYWMYGIVIHEDTGMNAAQFAAKLKEREVDTRPFFLGLHAQPALKSYMNFTENDFPVTNRIARQGLYLPSGLALTEEQQAVVCKAVREVLS